MSPALTVWKFPIPITDNFEIEMPKSAACLTVQLQHDNPYLWALVDPTAESTKVKFRLAGTGHPIEVPQEGLEYLGSFQLSGGDLVFHLFKEEIQ
jgi:hypothetical protein